MTPKERAARVEEVERFLFERPASVDVTWLTSSLGFLLGEQSRLAARLEQTCSDFDRVREQRDRVTAERDEAGREMLVSAGLVKQMAAHMDRLKAERDERGRQWDLDVKAREAQLDRVTAERFRLGMELADLRETSGKGLRRYRDERDAALAQVEKLRGALTRARAAMIGARLTGLYEPDAAMSVAEQISTALAATEPKDEEELEQCPSEWNGLQCCNVSGHKGKHEHRVGPLSAMVCTEWPATEEPKP